MIQWFIHKVIGSKNARELKKLWPVVAQINALEAPLKGLSDDQLRAKSAELKQRCQNGESLDLLLPEAFALVREAALRTLGQRHYDVQLIGGMVLHHGKISEMKTGEGKTLVATAPVYLNALAGKGVHVITVNDYLAKRDSEWMGQVYKFLGLTVGCIVHGISDEERRRSYGADVTYGTNNEFGFDYLRDNMKYDVEAYVQRELNYAIVDEVDSILIDEARTPLIISGQAEQSTKLYYEIDRIIPFLVKENHYTVDEKARSVMLTDAGVADVEARIKISNLYDPQNITTLHHVNQALRAHALYKRDVDYVVKEGKVCIVDEFTGRLMPGRRWSDGLHQAVEAKEKVEIENENQTLASVTFQNYFRMYKKLAGMTGTAETEAPEFAKIYNLDVMMIPTHRPMVRKDYADVIYKTVDSKFQAVIAEIIACHEKGQPVLVGTISIEKSELLSEMLKRRGIKHQVLNAKVHEQEAFIVAQAGRKGGVTISTNMAGRGTDIMLGGNPESMAKEKLGGNASPEELKKLLVELRKQTEADKEAVIAAGGLHIIGTERHESRRIDNQLRGRSGRQGDPGSSRFYLSLEDDLLRIFGGDRIKNLMERFGMKDDEVIEHPWLTRAIANAQKKVEDHNFSIRKNLLEYDDVMNQQRQTVYGRRRELLKATATQSLVLDLLDSGVGGVVDTFAEANPLEEKVKEIFGVGFHTDGEFRGEEGREQLGKNLFDQLEKIYEERRGRVPEEVYNRIEKFLVLSSLDSLWKDHLLQMDHLREGIGLRGYGQKDPLLEYKREGFQMFRAMMARFVEDSLQKIFHVQIQEEKSARREPAIADMPFTQGQIRLSHPTAGEGYGAASSESPFGQAASAPVVHQQLVHNEYAGVGRNDPCPCGSGKKFKKCHGA